MMTGLYLDKDEWASVPKNIPSLDGLRAVSILVVVLGHMLLPVSAIGIAAIGLKLFFFISGFLIIRLLFLESKSSDRVSLSNFYIRRFLRLYPVLFVYVFLIVLLTLAKGDQVNPIDIFAVFFYFMNYLVIHNLHTGGSLSIPVDMMWSLSVEEHFYLLAPFVFVFTKGRARTYLMIAILSCVLGLSFRLAYAHVYPEIVNTLELYWRTETRFDCIAYGVILACLCELDGGRRLIAWFTQKKIVLLSLLVFLASFAIRDPYFQNTWRFSLQGLCLLPLVSGVVFSAPFPWVNILLNSQIARWIGRLSYSLYIWHGGVNTVFGGVIQHLPSFMVVPSKLVFSFMLAVASYYVVEKPITRLRNSFKGRKQAAPA